MSDASDDLTGYRLLFECSAYERWMLDNVGNDMERGRITYFIREISPADPHEAVRLQLWRSAASWIEAHQREADLLLARGTGDWAYSQGEIEAMRRAEAS